MSDGIVYLTADFTPYPGTDTSATVERAPAATGPWTLIGSKDLLAEIGIFYDTTAPLDTILWYRWTGNVSGTQIVQGPYTETSEGTVLLKDPLRPWANLVLEFCTSAQQALAATCAPDGPELVWVGFGPTKTRRADTTLPDIYGAQVPADIWGRRKRLDGDLRVFSATLAALESVETLFTAGGPIQIQTPAEYGLPDIIVQPGDLDETYISRDQRRPYRLWEAPFSIVDAPLGPVQGTAQANWCVLAETYPTYADLVASGYTWGEVASGEAVPPPGFDGFGEGLYGDGPYGDGG